MAKGKKTGGRNFEKGSPYAGRPQLPGDVKVMRAMTRADFIRIANEMLGMTATQINSVMEDESTSAIKLVVAQIIKTAALHGDPARLNALLDRVIGKVPDRIAMAQGHAFDDISAMDDAQLEQASRAILEKKK